MEISLAVLVEQMFGYLFPVIGLSLLVRTDIWIGAVVAILDWRKNSKGIFSILSALIFLPLGVLTILVHPQWEWSSSVIVTVIGWIIIVKSTLVLFIPEKIFSYTEYISDQKCWPWYLKGVGLLYMILGLIILCPYWL